MYEPLAQLVEHLTFNQRVEGSSPSWLTSFFKESRLADVAQLVERRLAKAKVAGSRPVVRSILLRYTPETGFITPLALAAVVFSCFYWQFTR